jgi:AcrR family transcriptional regulator
MAKIHTEKNITQKDVIIKSAAALFKLKGFKATSMRDLADALGIEAPSLYNHIGSKNELLQAICFNVADKFTANLKAVEKLPAKAMNKIELLIRFHIRAMLEEFDEVFVANHEWKHLQDPMLNDFLNQRRSYEKRFVALIEKGVSQKELKKNNPYVVVLTILYAVRGLEFWQRHKKNISPTILEETMVSHLLSGIVK